jgi:ABC-2 type transport system permease protein
MKWGISVMPSKTSWFNKEIILQILRSVGWVSIVYFGGLFLALPLRMLMMYTDKRFAEREHFPKIDSLFQYDFEIQIGLLIVIPVLMSVFLFRFLHVRQAADLMHSLPLKREKIYHTYALGGAVLLVLPVAALSLIVSGVHALLDLHPYFQGEDILYWAGTTILLNLLIYSAGVFVGMMTGLSAVQGVLTYIFLLFPAGITVLGLYTLKQWLYGYPVDYYLGRNFEKLSPLTYAGVLDGKPLQVRETILYILMTLILYIVSLYFYKKRKSESASEAIAFPKMRAIFKYGVTFCMMLFGGMYFSEVQANSLVWMLLGYAVGAVIGYYIAEMVLQKTWRVFGNIKGLGIYAGVITLMLAVIQLFGFYEDKVPDAGEVKNVLLTETPHVYEHQESFDYFFSPKPMELRDNIVEATKLHEQIVRDKKSNKADNSGLYDTAFFLYELKNGNKVIRQYRINKKLYEDYYEPIQESEEYKKASNEIFTIDPDQMKQLTISANGPAHKSISFSSKEELKELLEIIQEDILAESYADSSYFQGRGSHIEILVKKDHFVVLEFKPTYKKLSSWLEERDLLERARVSPEDLEQIQVAPWDGDLYVDPQDIAQQLKNSAEVLAVSDPNQVGDLLDSAGYGPDRKYIVLIKYKGYNYYDALFMDEEHAPEFILSHFN